ncbi:hypothetical protein QC761_406640 [Podospora bellae-mahoneyi]|uniref:aspartate--tRNA ligase n=1 Tax=Podospora bellae-mahoneyi TaxID=2093777 RepID=A0ABR0FI41_9PEZI|nr:hypothetical protein QC761_406640 [Podospora bellae-mahoneyi]
MPVCHWNPALIPICLVEPGKHHESATYLPRGTLVPLFRRQFQFTYTVSQQQQCNMDEAAPPSKKAAKKAEAKARKEALKVQRADARQAPSSAVELDDPAKGFYGQAPTTPIIFSSSAEDISLRNFSNRNVEGKTIILRAWLQTSRTQSAKMAFVKLREEGNWTIQGVVTATSEPPEQEPPIVSRPMVRWIAGINPESFVVVEAEVQRPIEPVKRCRVSNFELRITRCYLLAPAPAILGMTLAAANRPVVDFNDEAIGAKAGVREEEETDKEGPPAATPVQQAIAGIRMEMKHQFRSYLKARVFKEFEPPSLIGATSEGGSSVFRMRYFAQEAFLAQSPQFYKQFEIAGGRKRVFSIAPVFRAGNSNTSRHMTEFTGLDLEMEIRNDYSDVLYLLEGVLLYIFRQVHRIFKDEIELVRSVYRSSEILLPEPGQEAQQLLREEGPAEFRHVRDDDDMSTPQEKALGALVRQKFNTDFYVVDKFPETARPFYAKLDDTAAAGSAEGAVKVTNAFDMFLRGQEILSGGQRTNHPDELEARIRAKGIDPASPDIDGYVQVFRQVGVPPHGGGGIGLDRIVAWYLGLPSVHLAAYYPRTPRRLLP